MQKITQGNWEVSGTTKGLNGLYIKANNQNIAQVFSSIPECEKNAKLIAAAPELLEALTALLDWVENPPNESLVWPKVLAKAAIKAATN